MWCSAFYDFADVRAVAVNRDRHASADRARHTRVERKRAAPDHGSPSRTVVRAPTVHGAQTLRAGTALSSRAAPRIVRSDRFHDPARGVPVSVLLSPRAAPTRRSDDQSTACPALPMPSRAAGRSPRREEPVEEVLIRLFRAMAKMASFRGILNIKSLNYELMSENSDYCVSGRDCPSVILSSAVSGAPR